MSASMLDRPWEAMLDAAVAHGIASDRGLRRRPHPHASTTTPSCWPATATRSPASGRASSERGLSLCAFSCHGNPLHPDPERARSDHADFLATCHVAAELGVPHVSLLAGLPAGAPGDRTPNWIVNSAFPGLGEVYRWQWEERVLPYWREAAGVADAHGVVLCVEPHSADVVYNTPTFRRLRDEVGPAIAMNFDPSHLWWQGMDPLAVVEAVGAEIRTCHVKDASLDRRLIERDGARLAARLRPLGRAPVDVLHARLRPFRAVLVAARDRAAAGRVRRRAEHRVRGPVPGAGRHARRLGGAAAARAPGRAAAAGGLGVARGLQGGGESSALRSAASAASRVRSTSASVWLYMTWLRPRFSGISKTPRWASSRR